MMDCVSRSISSDAATSSSKQTSLDSLINLPHNVAKNWKQQNRRGEDKLSPRSSPPRGAVSSQRLDLGLALTDDRKQPPQGKLLKLEDVRKRQLPSQTRPQNDASSISCSLQPCAGKGVRPLPARHGQQYAPSSRSAYSVRDYEPPDEEPDGELAPLCASSQPKIRSPDGGWREAKGGALSPESSVTAGRADRNRTIEGDGGAQNCTSLEGAEHFEGEAGADLGDGSSSFRADDLPKWRQGSKFCRQAHPAQHGRSRASSAKGAKKKWEIPRSTDPDFMDSADEEEGEEGEQAEAEGKEAVSKEGREGGCRQAVSPAAHMAAAGQKQQRSSAPPRKVAATAKPRIERAAASSGAPANLGDKQPEGVAVEDINAMFDAQQDVLHPTLQSPNPESYGKLEVLQLPGGSCLRKDHPCVVPASINRYLLPHQQEGIKWMFGKYAKGEGCLLADDMGLGKTIQVCALLAAILCKKGTGKDQLDLVQRARAGDPVSLAPGPILIVCPKTVVSGWETHLKEWGHFRTELLSGSTDKKERVLRDAADGRLEIVLTGYSLLTIDGELLKAVKWHLVIYDEYHELKSSKSQKSQRAQELAPECTIGLTGTPIQNNLEEFWHLMDLMQPGCLQDLNMFKQHFADPIKLGKRLDASAREAKIGDARQQELSLKCKSLMLRRTKEETLSGQLKGKTDTIVFCPLTDLQRELYRSVVSLPEFVTLATCKEACPCGRDLLAAACCFNAPYARQGYGQRVEPPKVSEDAVLWNALHPSGDTCKRCPFCITLPCIAKLLKISSHPALLQWDETSRARHRREDVIAFSQACFTEAVQKELGGAIRSQRFDELCRTDLCGKMRVLSQLLGRFHEEIPQPKVLLFSQSTQMMDIIEALLKSKGYSFLRIDGQTDAAQRSRHIQAFQDKSPSNSHFIFLISTKAGGLGLTLTNACKVIIYDVNWNPTHDSQAMDRAYRIGQLKSVDVYRLVSIGTLEELIYARQIYKQLLARVVLDVRDAEKQAPRQFKAVQGVKGHEGELFGIMNIMKFSNRSLMMEIRKNYKVNCAKKAEARRKSLLPMVEGYEQAQEHEQEQEQEQPGEGVDEFDGIMMADMKEVEAAVRDAAHEAEQALRGEGARDSTREREEEEEEEELLDAENLNDIFGLTARHQDLFRRAPEDNIHNLPSSQQENGAPQEGAARPQELPSDQATASLDESSPGTPPYITPISDSEDGDDLAHAPAPAPVVVDLTGVGLGPTLDLPTLPPTPGVAAPAPPSRYPSVPVSLTAAEGDQMPGGAHANVPPAPPRPARVRGKKRRRLFNAEPSQSEGQGAADLGDFVIPSYSKQQQQR
jgi:SNF2 family DNA or RNA helicase